MSSYQGVFKRYEKKYMLDETQFSALQKFLNEFMREDKYGQYTIGSLYYDSPNYELIRQSIEKPIYKEKLRVRCYGIPEPDSKVFVELKKKYKGVVYKRRVAMTSKEARAYLDFGIRPDHASQICREIDWFMNYYHPKPSVYLAYDRIALSGREDPDLRITFDNNIRWRTDNLDLAFGTKGSKLMEDEKFLMEIKVTGAIPFWLARELSDMEIYKTSFSKYGTCYTEHLLKHGEPAASVSYESEKNHQLKEIKHYA